MIGVLVDTAFPIQVCKKTLRCLPSGALPLPAAVYVVDDDAWRTAYGGDWAS